MRVKVFWQQGEDTNEREYLCADFSVLEDGSLFLKRPSRDTVMFNARHWIRVDVDNSGQ